MTGTVHAATTKVSQRINTWAPKTSQEVRLEDHCRPSTYLVGLEALFFDKPALQKALLLFLFGCMSQKTFDPVKWFRATAE